MKIEELNSCFDAVSPANEQKEKMLANIMKAKKIPAKTHIIKRMAIAAVIVFAVGIAVVLSLTKTQYGTEEKLAVADGVKYSVNTTGERKETGSGQETARNVTEDIGNQGAADDVSQKALMADMASSKTEKIAESEKEKQQEESKAEGKNIPAMTAPKVEVTTESAAKESAADKNVADTVTKHTAVSASGSSGGGSGGGGGSASGARSVDLSQIKAHTVYGALFPTYFAQGFEFRYATESKILRAVFENADGNRIIVTVSSEASADIISPENIAELSEKPVNFAIECGSYYVEYYAETEDNNELYKMVTSSTYFN